MAANDLLLIFVLTRKAPSVHGNILFEYKTGCVGMIPPISKMGAPKIGGTDFGTTLTLGQKYYPETRGLDTRKPGVAPDHTITVSVVDLNSQAKLPAESFDLILANDDIEHVEGTATFFGAVHRLQKTRGLPAFLVLNVRNIGLAYHAVLRATFPPSFIKFAGRLVPQIFAKSAVGKLLSHQTFFIIKKL